MSECPCCGCPTEVVLRIGAEYSGLVEVCDCCGWPDTPCHDASDFEETDEEYLNHQQWLDDLSDGPLSN